MRVAWGRSRWAVAWLVGIAVVVGLMAGAAGPAAAAPGNLVAVGCGFGCGEVRVYDARGAASGGGLGTLVAVLHPFGEGFKGGVRVAMGDTRGTGQADVIVGAGRRGGPHVMVYDGAQLLLGVEQKLASFFAFDSLFWGGVFVAAGKVDPAPGLQVVVGAGAGGGSHVRIFKIGSGPGFVGGAQQISGPLGSFFAYDPAFRGGVRVAAANFSGSPGGDQAVTSAGHGGGPHVKIFNQDGTSCGFFVYDARFIHGVYVAAGHVVSATAPSLITGAGPNGGPHVKVFDITSTTTCARTEVASFFAYDGRHKGGVRVGVADPMAAFNQATPGGGTMPMTLLAAPGPHGKGRERVKSFIMFPGRPAFTEIGYQGFTPFVEKHGNGEDAWDRRDHDSRRDDHDDDDRDDDLDDDHGRDGEPERPFGIYLTP